MGTPRALIAEYDIPYGIGSGRELHLDILRPDVPLEPPRPAVIWVHGGGWREGDRSNPPNHALAGRGFVTASVSYRFSQEAIFPAQIHDLKAAIRFLRANAPGWGIDPDRIGIWGHSAGGHLAALAAVTGDRPDLEGEGGSAGVSSAIQAAVPASPPTDFLVDWYAGIGYPPHEGFGAVVELLGGLNLANPEVRARARLASPARLATQNAAPVLVVHGTRDDLVPVTQGRLFVEALLELGADASLLELPDDDHGLASLFGDDWGNLHAPVTPAMEQTIDFFVRILGPVESV